jgi:hypothetical protein
MNSAVIVSGVGIVVSGVLGPSMTAWATRRANRQQFERERARGRRDDLRDLTDDAAKLLSVGATNLRRSWEAEREHGAPPVGVDEWSEQVFALEQRLRLRLPADHPVVTLYAAVRVELIRFSETLAADAPDEHGIRRFEETRNAFLDAARATLEAPIDAVPSM